MLMRLALFLVLATALAGSGCAFTTVTAKDKVPALGPAVATRQAMIMPRVVDTRSWPGLASDEPIVHVRLFPGQITAHLREGLVKSGLFTGLFAPGSPESLEIESRLLVTVKKFELNRVGTNAWVVPHLLIDGLVLPAFAAAAIATEGKVDLGAYLVPSQKMGTTLQVTAQLQRDEISVLERSYLLNVELEAVTERELYQSAKSPNPYGEQVGKAQGRLALDKLIEMMTADPHWAWLNDYEKLAVAEALVKEQQENISTRIKSVQGLLPLLRPLAWTPEEAGMIRDGAMAASMRASILNDIQARRLGLDSAEQIPAAEQLDVTAAEKLFDDPEVEQAQVQAELAQRVMAMAAGVLSPAKDQTEAPDASELRENLGRELARSLEGRLKLQELMLEQADKAVGPQWPSMAAMLRQIQSPLVDRYLHSRTGGAAQ
jgi:hypothetical protein